MNGNGVLSVMVSTAFVAFGMQTCSAMPAPIVSVEPSYLRVSPGENFTVNVTIDPEGNEIGGADCVLRFDNALLNATSLTPGTFFSGFNTMTCGEGINNTTGKIDYGEYIIGGGSVTEPGTFTTITFQVIGEHGVGRLDFETVTLSNSSGYGFSNVTINNGTYEIETVEQTPTPTPTQASTSMPSSGGVDGGGASETPTQTPGSKPTSTPKPTPTPAPTQTQDSTPAPTPTIALLPSLTPTPTLTITPTPSATASKPLHQSEEKSDRLRLPGFEVAVAVIGLLAISYLILRGKGGDK